MIDESTDFGARAARHLREDRVVWLTTVTPGGAPIPSPVWFWWDGDATVRMFSLPGTPRTRNIEANPKVALNFAGDGQGGDIVVLQGEATIDRDAGGADTLPPYAEKYAPGFQRIGLTAEQFASRYSEPITIRITRVRGH
jgi:PPOX class probable F420-dependent enzyme